MRRFQHGEGDAATALFLKYAQRLQALARAQTSPALAVRFDPEDVVQSVFRTFFRRASQGLYNVPEGDELWQLLLVLALNKIRDLGTYHRAQKRDVTRTGGSDQLDIDAPAAHGSDDPSIRILRLVVDEYFATLPESQRAIAQMRIEGHPIDDIAATTGRSKRTVERVLGNFAHATVQTARVGQGAGWQSRARCLALMTERRPAN